MKYFFQESYHDPTFSQKTEEGRVVCSDSLEPALSEERRSFVVTSFQTSTSPLSVSVSLPSGHMLFFLQLSLHLKEWEASTARKNNSSSNSF